MKERIQEQLVTLRGEGSFMNCHPWALEKSGMVFCAAVDEAVLKTDWGLASGWANDTLLSRIYGRRNGGELFFQLIEHARSQPEMMADFLELQYILLRLGFSGRYHDQPGQLQTIGYELYRTVQRIKPASALECPQMPSVRERGRLHRFRWGRITLSTLTVTLVLLLVGGGRYLRVMDRQEHYIQLFTAGQRL